MSNQHYLWMDCEMTGLDEKVHHLLEVAAIITTTDLKEVATLHQVILQPPSVLALMDDWCVKHHGESGLTAAVSTGTPIDQVDDQLFNLINKHFMATDRVVLCGNSIGNDRRFIDKYMPKTAKRLHYRMIDVSSFKEVFRDRFGVKYEKKNQHRAVGDIQESIKELETYLAMVKP